jgi:hypothetical protein
VRELEPEFKRALDRAQDAVVAAYGVLGGAKTPTDPAADRKAKRRLVALVETEIRVDGQRRMQPYLPRPRHLNLTDAEMRELYESRLPKDKPLRRDLLDWREVNRQVTDAGVGALKVLCFAVADAQWLIDTSTSPVEKGYVFNLAKAIYLHTVNAFGVDPTKAPEDRTQVDRWCQVQLAKRSPVPEWLRDARGRRLDRFRARATDAFTGRRDPSDDAEREAPPEDNDERRDPDGE